ncbi:hypothetical protein SLT67_06580 [Paenibacillus illinoisensis]|uniref:hypothetical protein n=1 Tax=Paenibacillus illinoisensis TaxID=59845 RepID=UPI003CEE0865
MNTPIHTTNQLHLNPNFGFALADSVVLAEAKVNISHPEGKNAFQLEMDPDRKLKDGRKVSVIAQQLDTPIHRDDAAIIYGQELGFVQYPVSLKPESTIFLDSIEGIQQPIQWGWTDFAEGDYELRISLHLKTPRIAEGPLEPEQEAMVKYAQVITVLMNLFPSEANQDQSAVSSTWSRDHHVFDGYGSAGFILADLQRMSKRVEELIGSGDYNLIEQFGEGDLSDTLLEEGLVAMAWGVSPWCYSIYSAPDKQAASLLAVDKLGEEPEFRGVYRIAPAVQQLSIVPAHELANWPACTTKDWPVIDVSGEGETLHMDLYVQICESVNGLFENPLPSFVLTRSEGRPKEISPLIDVIIVD